LARFENGGIPGGRHHGIARSAIARGSCGVWRDHLRRSGGASAPASWRGIIGNARDGGISKLHRFAGGGDRIIAPTYFLAPNVRGWRGARINAHRWLRVHSAQLLFASLQAKLRRWRAARRHRRRITLNGIARRAVRSALALSSAARGAAGTANAGGVAASVAAA